MYSCFPVDKSCFTVRLSPDLNTTSSPDFTNVDVDVPSTFPPAFAFHPVLFIASATSFAVTRLFAAGVFTFPFAVVNGVVFTSYFTTPFGDTLAVVKFPSLKFNPSANVTSSFVPPFAAYFNLAFAPIVEPSTFTVTFPSFASVVIPFAPTISNLIPFALFSCCVSVVVALSPPNWIVFVANSWNWEPFIASVDVALIVPGATFVILLPPALIPPVVIDTFLVGSVFPFGVTVNPSPFTAVLSPAAVLNSADVKPVNYLDSFTLIFPVLSTTVPMLLSDSLVLSAPPTISNLSFSFLEIVLFAFAGS